MEGRKKGRRQRCGKREREEKKYDGRTLYARARLAHERNPLVLSAYFLLFFHPNRRESERASRPSDVGGNVAAVGERGWTAAEGWDPRQVQGYTPAGNNERNQCCTAPLRRQSNGRRVRATSPLAPIAFCRPSVSATATTGRVGRRAGSSTREGVEKRQGEREKARGCKGRQGRKFHVAGSAGVKRKQRSRERDRVEGERVVAARENAKRSEMHRAACRMWRIPAEYSQLQHAGCGGWRREWVKRARRDPVGRSVGWSVRDLISGAGSPSRASSTLRMSVCVCPSTSRKRYLRNCTHA